MLSVYFVGCGVHIRENILPKRSNLDDPEYARYAWARYRRLMWFMTLFTLGIVVVALGIMFTLHGWVSIHLYIATALGVLVTMLLTAALMGLVFMSSGTGHDEAIEDDISKDIYPDE